MNGQPPTPDSTVENVADAPLESSPDIRFGEGTHFAATGHAFLESGLTTWHTYLHFDNLVLNGKTTPEATLLWYGDGGFASMADAANGLAWLHRRLSTFGELTLASIGAGLKA